jgi:hypothetical protein
MDDRPFVEGVIRHRRWVRTALRVSAIVLLFMGARWGARWAAWTLEPNWQFESADGWWPGAGVIVAFYVLAAVVLVLCEPWIVRWIVPYHAGGCLGCGYPAGDADRCPECGLPIPKDSVEASAEGRT